MGQRPNQDVTGMQREEKETGVGVQRTKEGTQQESTWGLAEC